MSQQMSNDQSILTDDEVISFLSQHPDFFIEHNEVLLKLRIRHESGKAISLIEHQLNRLRTRNQELQQQLSYLLETARENDRLFEKTRRLILELLEANSLDNLIEVLEDSLRHDFKVDKIGFVLLSEKNLAAGRVVKLNELQEQLGNLLNTNRIITGQFRETVFDFLFQKNHDIKSAAIAPLIHNNLLGVLALGSVDQNKYQRETGTLFLRQLSDILCRLLPRFL